MEPVDGEQHKGECFDQMVSAGQVRSFMGEYMGKHFLVQMKGNIDPGTDDAQDEGRIHKFALSYIVF